MILDTNALSALADGSDSLAAVLAAAFEIALPVIVIGEYSYGLKRSRHRVRYERWLEEFLPSCRVLPIDVTTSSEYAKIRLELHTKGQPIPSNDAWIAALARQHHYPILSRDQHFDQLPAIKRVSW